MENTTKVDAEVISKEEKFWRDVKERSEKTLFEQEQEIKLNKEVIKFSEKQIKACHKETYY